jgi:DNA-binding NtrC family response regulator
MREKLISQGSGVSRHIVLLQGAKSRVELRPVLASQQWLPWCVTHPEQISAVPAGRLSEVCIVVFDDSLQCRPMDLSSHIADSSMEWIAVATPEAAQDRDTAGMLATSFFDFHTLPVDSDRLLYCVGHAHGKASLRRSVSESTAPSSGCHGMIGSSPPMLALYAAIDKIAGARAPVLITGESGVGKELAARAIHRTSARHAGTFIPVNCGAIPETLIESHLFGHEKGAFTGAYNKQIGSIEAANGGTILLDEIGDLPIASQASLLRFLQESTVARIGSAHQSRVDVRVIAATHVDLATAVRAGRFREDLFYRLNVLPVQVPSLRERSIDILPLADHFFEENRAGKAPNVHGFSADARAAMQRHLWPGNIRELINRIQRAMVMCDGPLITAKDVQLSAREAGCNCSSLANARDHMERDIVESALARTGYNVAAAARGLGISRVTLYRLIKRLTIKSIRRSKEASMLGQRAAAGEAEK